MATRVVPVDTAAGCCSEAGSHEGAESERPGYSGRDAAVAILEIYVDGS